MFGGIGFAVICISLYIIVMTTEEIEQLSKEIEAENSNDQTKKGKVTPWLK